MMLVECKNLFLTYGLLILVLTFYLSNQFLRNAVAAFGGKLRLRLGGSLGDFVVYNVPGSDSAQGYCTYADFSPPTLATKIGYEFFSGCLEMSRWDEVNEFAMDVGAEIAFGLNGLYGRKPPKPCPMATSSAPSTAGGSTSRAATRRPSSPAPTPRCASTATRTSSRAGGRRAAATRP
jgi:hypothetical protein